LNKVLILSLIMLLFSCSNVAKDAVTASDTDTDADTDADMDNDADTDADTGANFDECTAVTEGAGNTYQPADIVFVIDNSPSLEDEIAEVRSNMNEFSQMITASGIDVQIVMISCLEGNCVAPNGGGNEFYGICIDPPLGAADGCQGNPDVGPVTDDTNLPFYKHLETRVPSVKGLTWIIETYEDDNTHTDEGWHDMIRTNSSKHFVVVSDDGDQWSASDFENALLALNPALFADYLFHGIFSYMSKDEACELGSDEPCCKFAAPGGDSTVNWDTYGELVDLTGGVSSDLCLQDFDAVFNALGASVIANSVINCDWIIPEPPEGETLDPNLLNVEFVYDGNSYFVGHVENANECGNVENGWYYDNSDNPTKIYVCPQTCEWFQSVENAQLIIKFGCVTEDAVVE